MANSTALIADALVIAAHAPNAATVALATAAAGPIVDYTGLCNLLVTKLEECNGILNRLAAVTGSDSTGNLAGLSVSAATWLIAITQTRGTLINTLSPAPSDQG